jgi:alcohol/geraniol dehydrogenase (NADP+)
MRVRCVQTIAVTTTADKAAEAKSFGATGSILTPTGSSLSDAFRPHRRSFDLLLVTATVPLDWLSYAGLLRTFGSMCLLGIPAGSIELPPAALVMRGIQITGSSIGSPQESRDMLAFAARHGVTAKTELFEMTTEGVNAGLKRVRDNTVRYRAVLRARL